MSSSSSSSWRLPERIIALSTAPTWERAISEWYLSDIEVLGPGDDDEKCLCGHYPIRELCHIANRKNGNTATVGNHCITKFDKADPAHEIFEETPLIIQAAKRLLENPSTSANPSLIDFAQRLRVFTKDNAEFYHKIWRKRSLTDRQISYKETLNRKLIYGVILSVQGAYQRLKKDRQRETAGPKLINYAFSKGVLTEKDRDFYQQIWSKDFDTLTSRQKQYRINLNQKILTQLEHEKIT